MKSLREYILEAQNESDFVIVEPSHKAYDELAEEMADAMISNNNGDPEVFILRRSIAKDMWNKYKKDLLFFEIPNGDLDQFEEDYTDGKIDYEELVKIDPKKL